MTQIFFGDDVRHKNVDFSWNHDGSVKIICWDPDEDGVRLTIEDLEEMIRCAKGVIEDSTEEIEERWNIFFEDEGVQRPYPDFPAFIRNWFKNRERDPETYEEVLGVLRNEEDMELLYDKSWRTQR